MAYYDSLKLEKGMYNIDFTKTLEKLDPSENYEGTSLAGLDAFQRQLKRFDIKVNGKNSDVIEKFFRTSESAVLFPEYIKRSVQQGFIEESVLPNITATVTMIDGNDYRTIELTEDEESVSKNEDDEEEEETEGVKLPETIIKNKKTFVKINKRGRVISSSYEALRLKRLDLFSVALKQIGATIAREQLKDAVTVLAGSSEAVESESEVFTYDDLIDLWGKLEPYNLNAILCNNKMMQNILALDEMRDAQAGLNFQGTGKMVTPLGATLVRASSVEDNYLIGIDKVCALEMVQAGEIIIDYDKLIDKQLERIAISSSCGFAPVFNDAIKIINYSSIS